MNQKGQVHCNFHLEQSKIFLSKLSKNHKEAEEPKILSQKKQQQYFSKKNRRNTFFLFTGIY